MPQPYTVGRGSGGGWRFTLESDTSSGDLRHGCPGGVVNHAMALVPSRSGLQQHQVTDILQQQYSTSASYMDS